MNTTGNIWPSIAAKLIQKNGASIVLIAVHPTYGQGMVKKEIFQKYTDGFINAWQTGENKSRILISALSDQGPVLWCDGEYERTGVFPDADNKFGLMFETALVFGSSAKSDNELYPGCVNLVSIALLDKGYAKTVRIIEEATLFPGRRL